jgi:hypothetical protein
MEKLQKGNLLNALKIYSKKELQQRQKHLSEHFKEN